LHDPACAHHLVSCDKESHGTRLVYKKLKLLMGGLIAVTVPPLPV
jgi:hypothetical protein